jgi:hypothetical protein
VPIGTCRAWHSCCHAFDNPWILQYPTISSNHQMQGMYAGQNASTHMPMAVSRPFVMSLATCRCNEGVRRCIRIHQKVVH